MTHEAHDPKDWLAPSEPQPVDDPPVPAPQPAPGDGDDK